MNILDAFRSKEDPILGSGVSEMEINNAEKELSLSFSKDYREYLRSIGIAMCEGHEFTGIGKDPRVSVVDVTRQMKAYHENIPDDWYVVENENMDGAVIWQDTAGNIYFNKHKEYNSFYELIMDL